MNFSFFSLPFWVAFIIFILIYSVIRGRTRIGMMLYVIAFGIFFAAMTNGWSAILLPLTALVSWYLTGLMMRQPLDKDKKIIFVTTILLALAPLVIFKYTNFLVGTFNSVLGSNFSFVKIALPIGISFYTFQAVSYTVDVYKGRFTDEVSLLEYTFYLTYFPLLMCGPITRAGTLIPQLKKNEEASRELLGTGLFLVICGLLKKALLADYLAQFNNMVFDDPGAFAGYEVFLAVLGYSMQIYLDFSGYSDMAIGLSSLIGIRLPDNFRFPYQSLNVTEFWRRWHISLSSWFKDYIYIPLGGNRKGEWRTYLNNFIVMMVAGLWHGASWMFVIWGAMHGIALVVHKFCKKRFLDNIPDTWYVKALSWTLTYVFVLCSWVFFRSHDIQTVGIVFSKVFTDFDLAYFGPFIKARGLWFFALLGGMLMCILKENTYNKIQNIFVGLPWWGKMLVFWAAVQLVLQFCQSSVQPLIYAQF